MLRLENYTKIRFYFFCRNEVLGVRKHQPKRNYMKFQCNKMFIDIYI